jgi:pentatricopeptide repeat protein
MKFIPKMRKILLKRNYSTPTTTFYQNDFTQIKSYLSNNEPEKAYKHFKEIQPILKNYQHLPIYTELIKKNKYLGKMKESMDLYYELVELNQKPDHHVFNTLLSGFAKEKNFEKMKEIEMLMKENKLGFDDVSYSILISANIDNSETCELLIKNIENEAIELNSGLCFSLIQYYAKHKKLVKMLDVYQHMLKKNHFIHIYLFKTIINQMSIFKQHSLIKPVYDEMLKRNYFPTIEVFQCIFKYLTPLNNFPISKMYFKEATKFHKNVGKILEKFIDCYILDRLILKVDEIFEFENYFEEFIKRFLEEDCFLEAKILLDKKPTDENLMEFVFYFSKQGNEIEVENYLNRLGGETSNENYLKIFNYLKENFPTIKKILNSNEKLNNIEIFNGILKIFIQSNKLQEAQEIFDWINQKEIQFNEETENYFIQLNVLKRNISENIDFSKATTQETRNTLLKYLVSKNFSQAVEFFGEMEKDSNSITIIFKGVCQYLEFEKIKEFYDSLENKNHAVNKQFIKVMLEEGLDEQAIRLAKDLKNLEYFEPIVKHIIKTKQSPRIVMRYLKENGYKPTLEIYELLLDHHFDKKDTNLIMGIYREMRSRKMEIPSRIYNKIMDYLLNNFPKRAEKFNRSLFRNQIIDEETFQKIEELVFNSTLKSL